MSLNPLSYEYEWAAIVALVAAGVALYGAWRANKIAEKNLSLSAELEVVKFREKWINVLRNLMSDFIAECTSFDSTFDHNKLNLLGNKILLQMNPDDQDFENLEKSIAILILRRSQDLQVDNEENTDADTLSALRDLDEYNPLLMRKLCHRILKREWDRIKDDIKNAKATNNAKNK